MFFEMFGTVTKPEPLKNWMSIPLREIYLLFKFGKHSSSINRSMTDKQNHMTIAILCHQHLRRIALRHFTKRCIYCLSLKTVPPLEKRCTWLSKSCDYVRNVTITCGEVFLWRIFSLSSVRLSRFGGCCPWRTKDTTNHKHFYHQFGQQPK